MKGNLAAASAAPTDIRGLRAGKFSTETFASLPYIEYLIP